jgi:hypothetical protein
MSHEIDKKMFIQLEKIARTMGLVSGNGGFKVLGTGTVSDVKFRAVVPLENTVFDAFSVEGVDEFTARGMSGITFPAMMYLPGGGDITKIGIASGSVIAYY